MKIKPIFYVLLVIVTIYLYRHELFNLCVSYHAVENIPVQELRDEQIMREVEQVFKNSHLDIIELNKALLGYTTVQLKFSKHQNVVDVNNFKKGTFAHCVGYAAFHSSILTYAQTLLNSDLYKISHQRGHVTLFGFKLNKFLKGNFYQDHDFVRIENSAVSKYYFCDPSLYEYFRIHKIQLKYGM
jgi:hypothetical protein